jgi:hypothetical protein
MDSEMAFYNPALKITVEILKKLDRSIKENYRCSLKKT